jgi:hypothetical protein
MSRCKTSEPIEAVGIEPNQVGFRDKAKLARPPRLAAYESRRGIGRMRPR